MTGGRAPRRDCAPLGLSESGLSVTQGCALGWIIGAPLGLKTATLQSEPLPIGVQRASQFGHQPLPGSALVCLIVAFRSAKGRAFAERKTTN
jgi:hypothetical protein